MIEYRMNHAEYVEKVSRPQKEIKTLQKLTELQAEKIKVLEKFAKEIKKDRKNCIASYSRDFRDGSHTAFSQHGELAQETAEKCKEIDIKIKSLELTGLEKEGE